MGTGTTPTAGRLIAATVLALMLAVGVAAGACNESAPPASQNGAPASAARTPTDRPPGASAEVVQPAASPGATPAPPVVPNGTATPPAAAVPVPDASAPRSVDGYPLHPFLPAGGRARVVVLDPGHGGAEVGAASGDLAEKDVNLAIALKLQALLEAEGYRVVLTRDGDRRAVPPPGLEPPADWSAARADLQARLDIANGAEGDVYLAIHNNGSGDAGQRGTEIWWDGRRPFAAYNEALATLVLEEVVGAIRDAGYPTVNRGLKEDSEFRIYQGRAFPIFVLGPPRIGRAVTRAGRMPAALGESLFLSNAADVSQLRREVIQDAIARGYAAALDRYFALIDSGVLALPPDGLAAETPNHYDIPGPPPGR